MDQTEAPSTMLAGDHRQYRIWIKAVSLPMFDDRGASVVALKIADLQTGQERYLRACYPGEMRQAMVVALRSIILELDPHGSIDIASDEDSLWKAFHPDHNWFEKWKHGGFLKKPDNNRETWRELAESMDGRRITIKGRRADAPQDRAILGELKTCADDLARPKPKASPGDPPQDFIPPDDAEWLYRRAIERDDV